MALNTTTADIERMFRKFQRIDRALESRFRLVGEQFVRDARMNASFTDRTGNLRSSIGYILLKDGQLVEESFEGQSEGRRAGEGYARDIASTHNKGYVLIVVAGMEYAAAVESKGYDVLTGSYPAAKTALATALKKIGDKFNQ